MTAARRRPPERSPQRLPTQDVRRASRRAMLAIVRRRQRPGSGSVPHRLMEGERPTMEWWSAAVRVLRDAGVRSAAAGAVAANAYMPPRHTADLDLTVTLDDLGNAERALRAAGWARLGDLELYEDLRGSAWASGDQSIDLVGLPGEWGRTAVDGAQGNVRSGIPTLSLPFVVLTKLISSRLQDSADIARVLGLATDDQLEAVRRTVERWRPQDRDDLEQMIAAGRLEYGR